MADGTTTQPQAAWMPTAGGVLNITAGALGLMGSILRLCLLGGLFSSFLPGIFRDGGPFLHVWGSFLLIISVIYMAANIISIIGGIFALQRKRWGWALAGGICAVISSFVIGVVALIFIALSRKEFN
jgi:hypothetical protein